MDALVFSQAGDGRLPLATIVANATRFFALDVDVLREEGVDPQGPAPEATRCELALRCRRTGRRGRVSVTTRRATIDDRSRAADAERLGRAAGMSSLADRCPRVWAVEAGSDTAAGVVERLLGALASAALGPVLPTDGSTLYGVRGALARAEREERDRAG
ncbi:MAG: hypothetical protein IT376_03045 [Polyangiaceae bacterium]|nr:hypothetical protein [Polyangiaceae bacterium]